MRILLAPNSNPENWISGIDNNALLREIVESRLMDCVLFQDRNFSELYKSLDSLPNDKREILRNSLQKSVITKANISHSEVTFGRDETLVSLRQNAIFEERLKHHRNQSSVNEPRDLFFDRTLGHLIQVAREVHIYDRYAFENLSFFRGARRSGTDWVLWERLSKLPIKVTIRTELPKKQKRETREEHLQRLDELKRVVLERVNRQLSVCSEKAFSLEIIIFELAENTNPAAEGDLGKHDRFGRITFDRHSVSFDMSKGLEIFKGLSMPENFKIHPLEFSDFEERSQTWSLNARNVQFFPETD